jgi:hypothetical protein
VGGRCAGFKIAQRGQLDFSRLGGLFNVVGKANRPPPHLAAKEFQPLGQAPVCY